MVEGTRIRLTRDVERFPHFIAPRGLTGSVVYVDEHTISARMDDHIPGAETWDNEVCWYPSNGDNITLDTEVIR